MGITVFVRYWETLLQLALGLNRFIHTQAICQPFVTLFIHDFNSNRRIRTENSNTPYLKSHGKSQKITKWIKNSHHFWGFSLFVFCFININENYECFKISKNAGWNQLNIYMRYTSLHKLDPNDFLRARSIPTDEYLVGTVHFSLKENKFIEAGHQMPQIFYMQKGTPKLPYQSQWVSLKTLKNTNHHSILEEILQNDRTLEVRVQ